MNKFILVSIAIAGLAALAIGGYFYLQSETKILETLAVKTFTPATKNSPVEKVDQTVAPAESSVADITKWEVSLKAACEAGDKGVNRFSADINEDGQADKICWRVFQIAQFGNFVDLMVTVDSVKGRQFAYIVLPADRSQHFAICSTESVSVEALHWSREQAENMGFETYPGPTSITISDGECDPPMLYWPKEAEGEIVALDFYRM